MYMSESGLFLLALYGAWVALGRFMLRALKRYKRDGWLDRLTFDQLRRFALWQVVFVAAWSVVFKLTLPFFMHSSHGPLYKGYSQYFAGTAELLGALLALYGLWRLVLLVPAGWKQLRKVGNANA